MRINFKFRIIYTDHNEVHVEPIYKKISLIVNSSKVMFTIKLFKTEFSLSKYEIRLK